MDPIDEHGGQQDAELTAHQQKLENARKTAADDIKWMMSSPRGRRIVWWLLEIAGVYKTSYPCDANMPFREGGRNIGLQIQARIIEHCPDAHIAMLNEHKAK